MESDRRYAISFFDAVLTIVTAGWWIIYILYREETTDVD